MTHGSGVIGVEKPLRYPRERYPLDAPSKDLVSALEVSSNKLSACPSLSHKHDDIHNCQEIKSADRDMGKAGTGHRRFNSTFRSFDLS